MMESYNAVQDAKYVENVTMKSHRVKKSRPHREVHFAHDIQKPLFMSEN